jgi:hypothetical protein
LGFDESREDFLTEASKAEIVGKNDLADIEGDGDISIDWASMRPRGRSGQFSGTMAKRSGAGQDGGAGEIGR